MKINRYLILSSSFIAVYLAFRSQINSSLLVTDLNLWLATVKLDFIGNSIFVTTVIIIFLLYLNRIKLKVKSDDRWLWIIGCVFLIYYLDRFIFQFWTYYPLDWRFKYFDLILVISFCEFLNSILIVLSGSDKVNNSVFELERPIENKEDDVFNRSIFAKRIADELNRSHFKESFSIGIVGEWSSGKSSFLNLIRSNLNAENRIILDFRPWLNYDKSSTVKSFFELMKLEMSTYDKNLSGLLTQYYQSISSLDNGGVIKIFGMLNPFQDSKTQSVEYKEINDALKGIGKQIVVIIDDLDRLDPRETIEVFKLIRNTANFHNTVYITAFDRTYVVHAIRKLGTYNPHGFIDKIFDLEYVLPEISEEYIIDDLNNFISTEIKATKLILKYTELEKIVKRLIVNKRDLRRLKHSLKINWVDTANELNFDEIIILEILRFKYPQVLAYFYRDNKLYLDWGELMPIDKVYTLKKVNSTPVILSSLRENEKSITNRFFLTDDSIDNIIASFEFLFSDPVVSILMPLKGSDQVARNSIRRKNYLDIYFSLLFHNGAIKFNEFIGNLDLLNNNFIKYADEKLLPDPLDVKTIQLFNWLRNEYVKKVTSSLSHENIVSLLLLIEQKGVSVPIDLFSEFYNLANTSIREFYNPKQLKLHFIQLFRKEQFKHFARCNIINGIIQQYHGSSFDNFILSLQELIDLNLWIFGNFLSQQPIVNNDLMFIYYKQYDSSGSGRQIILNSEANNQMHEYVTHVNRVNHYLNLLIRPSNPINEFQFTFEPYLEQTFGSFDNFKSFLMTVENYEHKEILIKYFERFEESNYKHFNLSPDEVVQAPIDFVNMFLNGRPSL